jgi:hypothetical protein
LRKHRPPSRTGRERTRATTSPVPDSRCFAFSTLRQLDSERGQGRGLRIAEHPDTWARVSKQQHAVDRYIVNDCGSINDCGDAMRPPPYPVFPGSSTSTTESLRRQGRGSRAPAELVATLQNEYPERHAIAKVSQGGALVASAHDQMSLITQFDPLPPVDDPVS